MWNRHCAWFGPHLDVLCGCELFIAQELVELLFSPDLKGLGFVGVRAKDGK